MGKGQGLGGRCHWILSYKEVRTPVYVCIVRTDTHTITQRNTSQGLPSILHLDKTRDNFFHIQNSSSN